MKTQTRNHLWRFGLAMLLLCLCSVQAMAAKAVPTGPWDALTNTWSVPDYNTTANWAFSPPLTKFVDKLPGLGKANGLGNYLSVAKPDIVTYPGSDYYEIDLVEFTQRLHSDLPAPGTKLRGYVQVNRGTNTTGGGLCGSPQRACTPADNTVNPDPAKYLGPSIVSQKDRPVRIKFTNRLAAGAAGDLFIPVDTTVMGAGKGPALQGSTRGTGLACDNTIANNACASYTQNRATIHMHGGRTPWISDGTPHQWVTPATENTPFPKGVSVQNVPDMPDPGDGSMTFFYSNQQSARLSFYHDHAFGITRLNVYAGEASGYLIQDPYELDLIARGIIPPDQIPLIFQDKTFVDAANVRTTDPLWNWGSGPVGANGVRTPVTGDLWLPHVYMPNQNPYNPDGSGINPVGRWFYGPWFNPPTVITNGPVANPYYDVNCNTPGLVCTTPGQPPVIPATPHPSMGMEAFMDTAVVNGAPFPVLEVDPRAYRFRILNAANDRGLNLSLYKADPLAVTPDARRLDNRTEVAMVPAVATPGWPALWPTDGRVGGVPDPALAGPSWIQIGTEGGFLPKPAVRPPQPITYVTDPTAFWWGVVQDTSLALMPAERADVIVDFSAYAGQTLIVYNDAPTAWPAMDPRYDFYTGAPDQRSTGGFGIGGAYDPATRTWTGGTGPLPGFGPNTRTVMQIVVRTTPQDAPYTFNQGNLDKEFTAAAPSGVPLFQRAQPPIIVAQTAYQAAYPATLIPSAFPWWGVRSAMNQQSLSFVTTEGKQVVVPMEPKGIHDEMGASFDPVYGRMSGNLAMQTPNPTTLAALLILYGYSDLPSETIIDSPSGPVKVSATILQTLADGTQIWDISHNGVDTHPIHFHLFDVQLVNRLGWDGRLGRPDPNELGWKDTIRISPLMDTIVAVRPVSPMLPFGIPNSLRQLNPAIPINSAMGFNNIDWLTGQARVTPVTNILTSFGWEYVWHCHILSHEEMDMMRPVVLKVTNTIPAAPTLSTVTAGAFLTWVDPTPAASPTTLGNPRNEIGFTIQRCNVGTCGAASTSWTTIGKALANATTYLDTTAAPSRRTYYRVAAYNAAGTSPYSLIVNRVLGTLVKPTITLVTPLDAAQIPLGTPVNISATATATTGLTIAKVDFYVNGVLFNSSTVGPNFTFSWTNATTGTYTLTAKATDSNGVVSLVSAARTITVVQSEPPASITVPAGSIDGTYTITWGASPTALPITYTLQESSNAAFTVITNTFAGIASGVTSQVITGKPDSTVFYYRVMTVSPTLGNSLWTTGANGCVVSYPTVAPSFISVPATSTNGAYVVSWGASTTPGATYTLEESTSANFNTSTVLAAGLPTTTLAFDVIGNPTGLYYYRVKAVAAGKSTFPWTSSTPNGCLVTRMAATVTLPAFSTAVLTGESQTPWQNVVPNALADYFTYVPYSNADAIALGFPSTCGNKKLAGAADQASSEDCYTITVQKLAKPLALQGIFGGGPGLRDAFGNPSAPTTAYGYGSGGANWLLPFYDTTTPTYGPVTAGTRVTGNAPAPFTDGRFSTAGVWHFPAPTIKGTNGRPVRVQWLNELPNEVIPGLDPSVDCGSVALNCFPYNRISTHVHGAHVGPESDGLASAWFTPNFAIKGEDFVSTKKHGPEGTYFYPMDQEASTIWYHDHAMGTTHLNTNMGMAGFFPITDANEQTLIANKILPTGAYELGFALQDRHFNTAGQFAMPDYPIYDLNSPGCTLTADGLADPMTCARVQWMKDPVDGHLIPYDNVTLAGKAILADIKNAGSMFNAVGTPVAFDPANAALLALPTNAGAPYGARAPFGATSATLEYFGNMPVVNGVVYGKYNVEPRMYRMRFIGGTDSRTWLMQLQANDAAKTIIPFWVIGTEQGLLNTPVQRDLIDLMPGERVDVLVDFSKIPAGTTRVMMNNLGDDAPWAGYFDYLAQTIAVPPAIPPGYPRSILIPEIMAFDIVPLVGTDNIAKPTINTALRPGVQVPVNPPTPIQNTRVVSLMEITDAFGRTMPTIDSRGFKPVGVPVTEIIKLNDIEQWDIVNTTVDAHPMHLHQVAFRVISRQLIDPAGFVAPTDDVVNQLFTAPTYTVALNSTPILPDAWDAGWKDTVASPPGYVTRVWAKFDLTGEYVWHCHILSHEEHDMMRNFIVTDASFTAPAPLSISVPATSNNGSYTVSWVGTAIPGVTYELQESTDPLFPATTATTTINTGNVPRFDAINKAAGSTYYYRVRSVPPVVVGQAKNFTTSPWRTGANGVTSQRVVITAPLPGNVPVGLTTISATVPAPAGLVTVKRVEFFVNGVLAGTAAGTTSLTYSVTNVTLAVGLYNLTAIAYYSDNTTSTSVAVTVTAAGAAATISLDSPATGATFDLGTAITLAATPSVVANTTVAWVLFYDGTTPVGIIDPTVPGFTTYSMSYTPATAGARSMSARVYYNNGIQATSASSAVTINGTVIAPASITVPTNSPINTSYSVSWTTAVSPTIGATYTLEESTSPTFDVLNTTTVTSGLQTTSVLISGKLTNGAKYYYRVMAVKSPMTSSAWITTNPIDVGLNVALQVNGGVATASSTFSTAYPASGVINGDRASGWGSGGAWTDATPNAYPDWVEIAFSGQKNISEIDVFTLQDAYSTPVIPTTTMTATLYGLIAFDVQYWDGVNNWITVPGGSITNNTLVWNKITFSSISTDRIRVNVNSARGASRIVEIEAWMADTTIPTVSISAPQSGALFTNPAQVTLVASATAVVGRSISKVEFYNGSTLLGTSPSAVNPYSFNWSNVPTGAYNITAIAYDNTNTSSVSAPLVVTVTGPLNVALASNGGTALASSEYSAAYPASGVINGDRIGGWGFGGAWTDATPNAYPDWVQITFNGPKTINEVDVFTLQDAYAVPVVPTPTLTATLYSLIAFDVEYWDGAAWVIVPGGSITNNTLVWNKINFPAITTSQIRVNVTAGRGGSSRIVEIEAWAP